MSHTAAMRCLELLGKEVIPAIKEYQPTARRLETSHETGTVRVFRPEDLAEALDLLAHYGDEAKILAGGQSLMPLMNMRLARPRVLVDINRLTASAISPAAPMVR